MSKVKHSSGDDVHPYLKGFNFWNKNRFWDNDYYTPQARKDLDEWVNSLRQNERRLTNLKAA